MFQTTKQIAIQKHVIFNSHVSLPEGITLFRSFRFLMYRHLTFQPFLNFIGRPLTKDPAEQENSFII